MPGGLRLPPLLGVNDSDVAVGFYTDANGNNGRFSTVTDLSLPAPA
jgi:hypothetical protein